MVVEKELLYKVVYKDTAYNILTKERYIKYRTNYWSQKEIDDNKDKVVDVDYNDFKESESILLTI